MATTDQIPEALLEPMIRQLWTAERQLQAHEEGWQISVLEGSLPPTKAFFSTCTIEPLVNTNYVQARLDKDYDKLRRDMFFHVTAKALEGSDLHLRALAVIGAMAIYNQHSQDMSNE